MKNKTIVLIILILTITLLFCGCSKSDKAGGFIDQMVGKVVDKILGAPPKEPVADKQKKAKPDSTVVAKKDSLAAPSDAKMDTLKVAKDSTAKPIDNGLTTQDTMSIDSALIEATASMDTTMNINNAIEGQAVDEKAEKKKTTSDILAEESLKKLKAGLKDYSKFRDPFDFDPYFRIEPEPPKPDTTVKKLPPIQLNITLDGIMWNKEKRLAMITGEDGKGYFITIGDKIKGAIVEDIQPDRVIFVQKELGYHEQRLELKLKKNEGS